MADTLALDHKNHHLGDIRRVVGDTFKVFRYRADLGGPTDGLHVLDHEGESFTENLRVQLIDFRIIFAHFESKIRVLADEGVETLADHSLRDACHPRDIDVRFQLGLLVELQGPLADVDGHVADSFEVSSNLEARGNKPEVPPGRL